MASDVLRSARDKLARLEKHIFTYSSGKFGSDAHVRQIESFLPQYVALAKHWGASTDELYEWLTSVAQENILPQAIADSQMLAVFDMDVQIEKEKWFEEDKEGYDPVEEPELWEKAEDFKHRARTSSILFPSKK